MSTHGNKTASQIRAEGLLPVHRLNITLELQEVDLRYSGKIVFIYLSYSSRHLDVSGSGVSIRTVEGVSLRVHLLGRS